MSLCLPAGTQTNGKRGGARGEARKVCEDWRMWIDVLNGRTGCKGFIFGHYRRQRQQRATATVLRTTEQQIDTTKCGAERAAANQMEKKEETRNEEISMDLMAFYELPWMPDTIRFIFVAKWVYGQIQSHAWANSWLHNILRRGGSYSCMWIMWNGAVCEHFQTQ